jgi:hypothetical protein
MHIRSAVEYLLQFPPAQGKYALNNLLNVVDSAYFPTSLDNAVTALKNSPLYKARESLVRNFIVVLLKKLLDEKTGYNEGVRICSALNAIEQMHKGTYDATFKSKFSSLIKILDDERLDKVFSILRKLTDSWSFLDIDVKQKLEAYVENLPKDKLDELEFLLTYSGLSLSANRRLEKTTRTELDYPNFFDLPTIVGDRIVKLYAESESFEQANNFSSIVVKYTPDYTKEQVQKIIRACGENNEIRNSYGVKSVVNAMRQNKQVTDAEINSWLIDVKLKKYARLELEDEVSK